MELPIIGRPVTCEQFLNSEPSGMAREEPRVTGPGTSKGCAQLLSQQGRKHWKQNVTPINSGCRPDHRSWWQNINRSRFSQSTQLPKQTMKTTFSEGCLPITTTPESCLLRIRDCFILWSWDNRLPKKSVQKGEVPRQLQISKEKISNFAYFTYDQVLILSTKKKKLYNLC